MTTLLLRRIEPPEATANSPSNVTGPSARLLHPASDRSFLEVAELRAVAEGLAVSAIAWPGMNHPTRRVWDIMVASDAFEAWVIAWPPGGAIELHDHGESSGAVVVASGELTETKVTRDSDGLVQMETTVLPAGAGTTFEPPNVHDLVNGGTVPAISVHTYAPRLTAMTHYDMANRRLVPGRTVRYRLGAPIP
ncbi:MAG TPA: cysteine dioxygenase family protein [Acidimicrobiales bacterium]|nr:cysteine dioxygenase family protein [Acidimicrobiales bacterium]